jgi:transposase
MPVPHPEEFRQRVVALAFEVGLDGNRRHPIAQLARDVKVTESCLRNWRAAAQVESGEGPG